MSQDNSNSMIQGDQTSLLLTQLETYFLNKNDFLCVLLYGSFAKGKANSQSDIDLAVLTTEALSPELKMQTIENLSLLFGRSIDVVDLRTAHVPLSQEILTQGLYIKLINPEIKENLIKKMIYEATDFLPIKRRIQTEKLKRFIKS